MSRRNNISILIDDENRVCSVYHFIQCMKTKMYEKLIITAFNINNLNACDTKLN